MWCGRCFALWLRGTGELGVCVIKSPARSCNHLRSFLAAPASLIHSVNSSIKLQLAPTRRALWCERQWLRSRGGGKCTDSSSGGTLGWWNERNLLLELATLINYGIKIAHEVYRLLVFSKSVWTWDLPEPGQCQFNTPSHCYWSYRPCWRHPGVN